MTTRIILLLGFLVYGVVASAQHSLFVYDIETRQPVIDAFFFIDKTNYGSTSGRDGGITIHAEVQEGLTGHVTHLNYAPYSRLLRDLMRDDTVWLSPTNVDLDEVEVTAKSSNKRKRWIKRFEKDVLGIHQNDYEVSIQNPEVLLFYEAGNSLIAEAREPLEILNGRLGFKMLYWLESFTSKGDLVQYQGKSYFVDLMDQVVEEKENLMKQRSLALEQTLPHFLQKVASFDTEKDYDAFINRVLPDGQLEQLSAFSLVRSLHRDPGTDIFELSFDGVLEIVHLNRKASAASRNYNLSSLGHSAERDMIQQEKRNAVHNNRYERSYLFSSTGKIRFDKSGRLLNSSDVKEYGYWAQLGLADAMPSIIFDEDGSQEQVDLLRLFEGLIVNEREQKAVSIRYLTEHWRDAFIPPILELKRLSNDTWLLKELNALLEEKIEVNFGTDYGAWMEWLWKNEPVYEAFYTDFKGKLYKYIDPKFEKYFMGRNASANVRVDEILWGGVQQDGIPPLRYPKMIPGQDAEYLGKDNIVFGMVINGIARAYPKRILAWHEFFVDDFEDTKIAGVYCTLCGTVVAYDMKVDGNIYDLGTSGFLYRSNKLMYDKATQSLWNTLEGVPVLGPLSGQNIRLESHPVVTTTWESWLEEHPETTVLSLETGHERNYDEGKAYQDYFSTDELMFPVPKKDSRLNNKDEVLVIRTSGYLRDPLAISIKYLERKRLHEDTIDGLDFVVLTSRNGASRVYERKHFKFDSYRQGVLRDDAGDQWHINEDFIKSPDGDRLRRLPAHNSFWFAWYNMHPDTRLVK